MALESFIPWLYMAIFLVIGWRLYIVRWPIWIKAASAIAMVTAPPLLMLLPALRSPSSNAAAIAQVTALSMFLMGALCLAGGFASTWLMKRRRRH